MTTNTGAAVEPTSLVEVGSHTSSIELVALSWLSRVAAGELTHTCTATFDRAVAPASLLDDRYTIIRSASSDQALAVMAEGADALWTLTVRGSTSALRVAAHSRDAATRLTDELSTRAGHTTPTGLTEVRVWHAGPHGVAAVRERAIEAPAWADIARNYPTQVRGQLDELLGLSRPSGMGKLILWHGEPGTGKTTAARALFGAWAGWCAVEYITDPERFVADPGYMNDVIARPHSRSARPTFDRIDEHETTWRVIVAEDADDHLRATGSTARSTGLSRLLNLADGVLGQGVNSLILLTTNEPLDSLHPALVRPGRALARIGFTRFSPSEGADWLDEPDHTGLSALTLAELYHRRRPADRLGITSTTREHVGHYI